MTYDLLIRSANVFSGTGSKYCDIGITSGKIVALGDLSTSSGVQEIDGEGLAALPGMIDTQVHFREPGAEHKEDIESGSRAAIMGGVTSFFEMPNTNPATTDADALNDKLRRAEDRSWSNYAFFVGATVDNISEISILERLPGAAGIKIFMGSSTGSLLIPDDLSLIEILGQARRRVSVHSEDHQRLKAREHLLDGTQDPKMHPVWRDSECARLSTERLINAARQTGASVHLLHVSTKDELKLISDAKAEGIKLTAEVTPQHLWFSAPDCYDALGTFAQMNPPIRSSEHRAALREALAEGLFDVFGSDHAPHAIEEKSKPYPASPSGMPGVQTLLLALLTLGVSPEKIVRMAAETPARLFEISNKGFIDEGYDADLVLVDLNVPFKVEGTWLQSKCGWSPYEGAMMSARVCHVVVNGKWSVRDGQLHGSPAGQMIKFRP